MNEEPFHIRQTSDAKPGREAQDWANAALAEIWSAGVGWWRVSWQKEPFIVLLEAWKERPFDEGKPRYQVVETT